MAARRLPYDDVDGELVDIEGLAEGAGQRIVFGVFIARLKALHREGVAAFLIVFELLHADLQLVDAAAEAVVRLDDVKLIFTVIGIMPLHRPGDVRNDGFVDGVLLRERVAARGEGIVVRMAARQRKSRRHGMFARVRAVACGHFVTDEAHAARQVAGVFEAGILHLPVVDVFADGELDIIFIVMNIKLLLCNGPGEAGISIGIFAVVAVARRPLIVLRVLQADADPILARVGCLQIRNAVCIIIRRPVCRTGKAHHFRIEADQLFHCCGRRIGRSQAVLSVFTDERARERLFFDRPLQFLLCGRTVVPYIIIGIDRRHFGGMPARVDGAVAGNAQDDLLAIIQRQNRHTVVVRIPGEAVQRGKIGMNAAVIHAAVAAQQCARRGHGDLIFGDGKLGIARLVAVTFIDIARHICAYPVGTRVCRQSGNVIYQAAVAAVRHSRNIPRIRVGNALHRRSRNDDGAVLPRTAQLIRGKRDAVAIRPAFRTADIGCDRNGDDVFRLGNGKVNGAVGGVVAVCVCPLVICQQLVFDDERGAVSARIGGLFCRKACAACRHRQIGGDIRHKAIVIAEHARAAQTVVYRQVFRIPAHGEDMLGNDQFIIPRQARIIIRARHFYLDIVGVRRSIVGEEGIGVGDPGAFRIGIVAVIGEGDARDRSVRLVIGRAEYRLRGGKLTARF